jgi:hypothetical protein
MLGSALEDCLVLKSKRRKSNFGQKIISEFFKDFKYRISHGNMYELMKSP